MTTHGHHHAPSEIHEHDLGRRGLFGVMGGLGAAAALTACAAGEIPEEAARALSR